MFSDYEFLNNSKVHLILFDNLSVLFVIRNSLLFDGCAKDERIFSGGEENLRQRNAVILLWKVRVCRGIGFKIGCLRCGSLLFCR